MKRKTFTKHGSSTNTHGQTWLANELRISQQRISKLVSDPEWPFKRAAWTTADVAPIRKYLALRRAGANASATATDDSEKTNDAAINALSKNPERIARIRLLIERTAKIKLERELLAGNYLKREDVDRSNIAKVYAVRAKLAELPLRVHLLLGKDESQMQVIVLDWVREVCNSFAGVA